jgi:Uma2 family endonuclease
VSTTTAHLPLYTVDEYFALVEAGRLDPDARVELLEGVIVGKSPQTPRHAATVSLVQKALVPAFDDGVVDSVVMNQRPFIASDRSGPEPDVAVVPGTERDYVERHPSSALLVVEVADSSLSQDRLTKSRIYAAAGVPEYWIVNLVDEVVEVYRSPDADLRLYAQTTTFARTDSIRPVHAPGVVVHVADLLP